MPKATQLGNSRMAMKRNGRWIKEWSESSYLKLPWAQHRALGTDSASHPSCHIRRDGAEGNGAGGRKKLQENVKKNEQIM